MLSYQLKFDNRVKSPAVPFISKSAETRTKLVARSLSACDIGDAMPDGGNEEILFEAWKSALRDWFLANKKSMRSAARELNVTGGAISAFLMIAEARRRRGLEPIRNSSVAVGLARMTGIPMPKADATPRLARVVQHLEIVGELSPPLFDRMADMLERAATNLMNARQQGIEISRDIELGTRNDREHAEPERKGRRRQRPSR